MLKPNQEPLQGPEDEQPIGEVVSQLIDEGKAYARAEINVAKAIVADKVDGLKWPAVLFAAALLAIIAGVTAMAVAVALTLAPLVGPLLAGLIVLVLFGGLAGGLAWLGIRKLQEVL